ncbi:SYT9 [Branchiostoma lanceolatum]|uniref:SYT9 protein n=2 Tax=Branchiostoma lanceolatum TaxID=7740 RepID=A0A8J9YPV9_BRALA|nr:SYT9 [Branchiostoma lanceolatum]
MKHWQRLLNAHHRQKSEQQEAAKSEITKGYSLPEESDPSLDPDTQRSLSLDAKFSSLSVSEEEFDDARIRRREKRAGDRGLKRQARQESMGGLADDDFSPTSSPFGSNDSVEGVRFEEVTRPVRRKQTSDGGSLRRWSSEKARRRSSGVSEVSEENSSNGRRITRRRSIAARATIDLGAKEDVSEVMFSMGYHPNAGQLTVTIIKARNLARVGSDNPPDTYIRVALMCESRKIGRKKTSVQNGVPNPTYNESFHFDVAEDDMKGVFLSLVVEDSGGPTLGKCEVGPWTDQWNEMMDNPRKPVTRWCQLKEVTSDRRRSSEDQE